jgi:GntR family transcriptional repressor for pyruvate dehydrogenase complex
MAEISGDLGIEKAILGHESDATNRAVFLKSTIAFHELHTMKNAATIRPFGPVRVILPSEAVARRLADAVRTGFFRVGSRLPSERSLAEQMQVSRPTIREAVKLLVEADILTVRPGAGGGTFVTSEIVPLDLIFESPEMRPGEIDEALEVRRLLLPWVVQIASQYAEDDDYDLMREAIAFGLGRLPKPSAKTVTSDHVHSTIIATMRFDLALAKATRNSLTVRLMDLCCIGSNRCVTRLCERARISSWLSKSSRK